MKKTIFFLSLALLVSSVFSSPALAASSFSFSPASVSVVKGGNFSSSVSINPGTEKIYTVKLVISYPADKVEITGFTFSDGWMSGFSPEDKIDNTNGLFIKTAGWPKGFNAAKTIGTISFRSKTAGSGEVLVSSSSLALTDKNANNLSSAVAKISFSVSEPSVSVSSPKTSKTVSPPAEEKDIESSETSSEISASTTVSEMNTASTTEEAENENLSPFLARIANLFSFKDMIIVVLILALAFSVFYSFKKNRK